MNQPTNVVELQALAKTGALPKMLLFWGHRKSPGDMTKACLSQWYPSPFTVDGVHYKTAEHFMMAEKARLFADPAMRAAILQAASPDDAKKLGRKVHGFDSSAWEAARFDIVVRGNHARFSAHPTLRDFLLRTGDKVLVEASPYDDIWGIGAGAEDPRATDPRKWPGLNLLGFALMEVRRRLRTGS